MATAIATPQTTGSPFVSGSQTPATASACHPGTVQGRWVRKTQESMTSSSVRSLRQSWHHFDDRCFGGLTFFFFHLATAHPHWSGFLRSLTEPTHDLADVDLGAAEVTQSLRVLDAPLLDRVVDEHKAGHRGTHFVFTRPCSGQLPRVRPSGCWRGCATALPQTLHTGRYSMG
jgi:hypothetical protein